MGTLGRIDAKTRQERVNTTEEAALLAEAFEAFVRRVNRKRSLRPAEKMAWVSDLRERGRRLGVEGVVVFDAQDAESVEAALSALLVERINRAKTTQECDAAMKAGVALARAFKPTAFPKYESR